MKELRDALVEIDAVIEFFRHHVDRFRSAAWEEGIAQETLEAWVSADATLAHDQIRAIRNKATTTKGREADFAKLDDHIDMRMFEAVTGIGMFSNGVTVVEFYDGMHKKKGVSK